MTTQPDDTVRDAAPDPAPADPKDDTGAGDAGQDESIRRRLERDPKSRDAKLDAGLDESMDASDPPASVQPGRGRDPSPSSGYDAGAEAKRRR